MRNSNGCFGYDGSFSCCDGDQPPSPPPPRPPVSLPQVNLIIDTDMSIDVDDVLAVAIAHALADLGEVKLVAVLLNVNLREGASTISTINRYFGRDVPIGMYDGPLGDPAHCAATPTWVNSCRGFYATDVARRYATFPLQNQSALELYRQALHDAADGSIRIASIGLASNLRDLLRSPPDAVSPLSGWELLRRKVTKMYMMGGRRLNGNPVSALTPHS